MSRKTFKYFIFFIIFFCLTSVCSGCNTPEKQDSVRTGFDSFLNDFFVQEVQTDTLSLNYSLSNPENYGIEEKEPTLGQYSVENMNENMCLSENYLKRLNSYDFNKLSPDQQLTWHILKEYLEMNLDFGNYLYYSECLGPTTGVQAQLPILLAEYSFDNREDIERYLDLLPCVYDYFEEIAQFEREKSRHGLFMSDAVADRIIDQCEAFIKKPEENFLIEYFDEKISDFKGLSRKEQSLYKKENKDGVLTKVIPAYELLIDVLLELKGTGTNTAGLYYYPEGQAYYECLADYKTGSDKSMEEMADMLDKAASEGFYRITRLTMTDSSLVDKYLSFTSFPITDPEAILNDLKKDISRDFPAAIPVNCEIKYVPKSLSDYLSPAMYLVPPIDNYKNNNIYINGNDKETLSMIYTTVAHEGYPGHLYQCVYFRSRNPSPIRNVMNFLGYDEGWATYVELYSYHLAGIDENLADFLEANNLVILCMYARADIGIHYEGWKKDAAVSYLRRFIDNEGICESIYSTLLEEPSIYLPYAVGCLEIMELRDRAENELGDKFNAREFHKFLLDIGPAEFGVINEYMTDWIKNR